MNDDDEGDTTFDDMTRNHKTETCPNCKPLANTSHLRKTSIFSLNYFDAFICKITDKPYVW
jgi:hypothetical protein